MVMASSVVGPLFFILIILTINKCMATDECADSQEKRIPVCRPGAVCSDREYSYSCNWPADMMIDGSPPSVSPYMALNKDNQSSIPSEWQLADGDMPYSANECLESVLRNISLCQDDAICSDLPFGYVCQFLSFSSHRAMEPFRRGVCDNQVANWTCPYDLTFRWITPENALDDLDNMGNDLRNINVSTISLNDMSDRANSMTDTVALSMNARTESKEMAGNILTKGLLQMEKVVQLFVKKLKLEGSPQGDAHIEYPMGKAGNGVHFNMVVFPQIPYQVLPPHQPGREEEVNLTLNGIDNGIQTVDRTTLIVSYGKISRSLSTVKKFLVSVAPQQVQLLSNIVSATVHYDRDFSVKASIRFEHHVLKANEFNSRRCGYFHSLEFSNNPEFMWKFDGCEVNITLSTWNSTTCDCQHLSNIGALLYLGGSNDPDKPYIKILAHCCSIVCIVCLLVLLVVLIKSKRSKNSSAAYLQQFLVLSLLLGNVFLYVGGTPLNQNRHACMVLAVLTQYAFLVAFTWKLLFGWTIARVFTSLTNKKPTSKQKWIHVIIGFLSPAIIVAISVGLRHEDYGEDGLQPDKPGNQSSGSLSQTCWISSKGYTRLSFFIPVVFVLAVNFVNILRIAWAFIENARRREALLGQNKGQVNEFIFLLQASLLTGLPWLFGILVNVERFKEVFTLLFLLAIALQGLVLLTYTLVAPPKNRRRILSIFSRSSASSKTTSSESTKKGTFSKSSSSKQTSGDSSRGGKAVYSTSSSSADPPASEGVRFLDLRKDPIDEDLEAEEVKHRSSRYSRVEPEEPRIVSLSPEKSSTFF